MMARRSPLRPGAYGKPQRWHEILTESAEARAAKRIEQQRRNNEAAQSVMLVSTASIVSLVG
ncbi:hypothetical protein [Caulobacter segnis]|uniref:hypothetical protein n=1 Tax=Caulobacter segnis TaxID=88688 RepID=UPI002854DB81|nr:hypothetical protein [Caulobacter segnis]MDR6627214.1 hypothetical protein [Caulobacter segnis]